MSVKVARPPTLQSSLILSSEVWRTLSGKMYAFIGYGRFGKSNVPLQLELMVEPFGSVTEIGCRCESMMTAEASDCRTKRFVDPVSLHASLGAEEAKERCGGLQSTVLVTVA